VSERSRLWLDRWIAVATDRRSVPYLGASFEYDGRFVPLLLPAYLHDVARLDALISLGHATVIDIGANVGQFGATVARRFPDASVWSFEPNKTALELICRNAAASSNWTIVPWGIAGQDQTAKLWAVEGHSAQGSLYRGNALLGLRANSVVGQAVELKRLSEERRVSLRIPETVDLLKIDVEGAEGSVLPGLADVRWRYMTIETSLGREGGLTVTGACDLCQEIWQQRPNVIWTSTPEPDSVTVEAILAMRPPQP
jgi:FkbM family methyltransferase